MQPDTGSDFPIAQLHTGQPVPDLHRTDPARWHELLAPLSPAARQAAIHTAATPDEVRKAWELAGVLQLEDGERRDRLRRAAREAPSLAAPAARPRATLAGRQVNVRLRHRDFAALTEAAALLDIKPTQLARTFIINGS